MPLIADYKSVKEIYKNATEHGGSKPSTDLADLDDLELDLIDDEDNSISIDLTFRKKIKVI